MDAFAPFVIIGIVSGSIYGLAGVGLVLTYRTSGVFNFAHGAIATCAAITFYELHVGHAIPWPIAALVSVLVLGPLMGIVLEPVGYRLAGAGAEWQVLATVGLSIVVLSGATLRYDGLVPNFPNYLPTSSFEVGGVFVGANQIIIAAIGVVSATALYLVLKRTTLGVSMRAVVDDPELVELTGDRPTRVRRWAWSIGTTFASLSGILLAPSTNLDARALVFLVIQAFGAAALGSFTSLPMTYAGGILLGIASAFSTKYVVNTPWLAGLPAALPFLVLFGVLIVRRPSGIRVGRTGSASPARSWRAPPRVRHVGLLLGLTILAIVPHVVGTRIGAYTSFLVYVILFLSLGLLVRTSGQVSLCHFGLAAIGATTFARFAGGGMPWLVALLLGALVAAPIGAVIAMPAIRVSGVFLALATFGFGELLQSLVYNTDLMFGPSTDGVRVPRPGVSWLEGSTGYYYLVLTFLVMVTVSLYILERSRLGRLLQALADSPLALETHGATSNITRLVVFVISAFIAGLAGGLLVGLYGFATGGVFTTFKSLTLLVVLLLASPRMPWYALIAAASVQIIPTYITSVDGITDYMNLLFGIAAVAVALFWRVPPPVPAAIARVLDRLGKHSSRRPLLAADVLTPSEPRPGRAGHSSGGLVARAVTVRYGGAVALAGVTVEAPLGRITGLIGPNGAGKTTLFNACSGLVPVTAGSIDLFDEDITRLSVPARARRGLGRTFQRSELWGSMTVSENVSMGCEAGMAGGHLWNQLVTTRRERANLAGRTAEAMRLCRISHLAEVSVRRLTTGQRRLVELARSLAGDFDLIMLDEPSSGMDPGETRDFGEVLRCVVDERNIGVLLVEHDMSLVMTVCAQIEVIDFGRPIFSGSPSAVAASPVVRAAYLGDGLPSTAGAR